MSLYKTGFKDALELLQRRLEQRQISDVKSVFHEIDSMNERVKTLYYQDFQLSEMPSPTLQALFGVVVSSKR